MDMSARRNFSAAHGRESTRSVQTASAHPKSQASARVPTPGVSTFLRCLGLGSRWGRRFACLGRTGPRPFRNGRSESCSDRVTLDVTHDSFHLTLAANPMIVRLVLPEWLPASTQDLIGPARRGSLQPSGDHCQIHVRQQKQMDVVGHDHISPKLGVLSASVRDFR